MKKIILTASLLCTNVFHLSPTAVAMEENSQSLHSTLPKAAQEAFTKKGHEILTKLYSEEPLAVTGTYNELKPHFHDHLEAMKYSPMSEYSPDKIIRGLFASPDQKYVSARKDRMIAMTAIMWALVDKARQQNEFFERGSFTILDPDHKLYNFLLDYVKLVTGYESPKDLPFEQTISNFAYRRDPKRKGSSHHKDHCPDSQFGVDIRFEPQESVSKLLPFNYTHFLFAKLDLGGQKEDLLFVKLEPLGIGSLPAMVMHGAHFAQSQSHVESEARREKDIPKEIEDTFNILRETRELKEEKTVRNMYLKAMDIILNPSQEVKYHIEAAGQLLYYCKGNETTLNKIMEQFLELCKSSDNPELIKFKAAHDFMNLLDKTFPDKNHQVRTGNEVILKLGKN